MKSINEVKPLEQLTLFLVDDLGWCLRIGRQPIIDDDGDLYVLSVACLEVSLNRIDISLFVYLFMVQTVVSL